MLHNAEHTAIMQSIVQIPLALFFNRVIGITFEVKCASFLIGQ